MPFIKSKSYLWLIIMAYVAVIYITLPIMRPVQMFLQETLGEDVLSLAVNLLLVFAVSFSFILIVKKRSLGRGRLALIFAILLAGAGVAMGYEIAAERIHFLEYGILGSLVFNAAINRWKIPILSSFVFVSIIGIGDETIQWFLPNRIGDIRDVFMNSVGGLLGISVTGLWNGKI